MMKAKFLLPIVTVALLTLSVNAGTVFDSVGEFSGTQGQDNWFYGYYAGNSASPFTPSDFEEMPQLLNNVTWIIHRGDRGGYWTSLSANGGHPNGPVGNYYQGAEHWSVRRWASEMDGTILIEGNLKKGSRYGDGTIGHIFINDVAVFSQRINGSEIGGIDYSIQVDVNVGDTIDFSIQPIANDLHDSTQFTAIGTVVSQLDPPVIEIDGSLNADGCIEASSPSGAAVSAYVGNFIDKTNIVYYWSNEEGLTAAGPTFEFNLGMDQSTIIFLTVEETLSGETQSSFEQVRVSDTTPPHIEILDPQQGKSINGNNLFLNAVITDTADTNIVDYTVHIGTTANYPIDQPESGITSVHLFKPSARSGPVPSDITVTAADASGNTSQATVQVMLQHDNRKEAGSRSK